MSTHPLPRFSLGSFSLEGKNALVTGGNTGLGRAFSDALARAGANVFVVGLQVDDGTTESLIHASGREMGFLQADITAEGVPARAVAECIARFGSIDILVNCAGLCINIPDVTKFTRSEWDKMIAVNLTAVFEMSHEAAKAMIPQRSGKIINIGSMFSYLGGQWSPAYATTKTGVLGFTKAYCDELAQFNIQVNAIAPGYYATDLTLKTRSDPVTNQRVLDHIPANRWGDVEDLMGTVVFLASTASDYVNGVMIPVDGGYLVR